MISGTTAGLTGPADTHDPVLGLSLTLDPSAGHDLPIPAAHRAFAHVRSGSVLIAGRPVHAGQTAWSDPVAGGTESSLHLAAAPDAAEPASVLLFSAVSPSRSAGPS